MSFLITTKISIVLTTLLIVFNTLAILVFLLFVLLKFDILTRFDILKFSRSENYINKLESFKNDVNKTSN